MTEALMCVRVIASESPPRMATRCRRSRPGLGDHIHHNSRRSTECGQLAKVTTRVAWCGQVFRYKEPALPSIAYRRQASTMHLGRSRSDRVDHVTPVGSPTREGARQPLRSTVVRAGHDPSGVTVLPDPIQQRLQDGLPAAQ
jgi:hypothetical protein